MSHLLISLPQSVGAKPIVTEWLERNINSGHINVKQQIFPPFKVGTLDSLVIQSEDLAKFDNQLHQSILKVLDIKEQLNLPQRWSSKEDFLNFHWDTNHFRIDKPISDLIQSITNNALQLDTDLRTQFQAYNTSKSNLLTVQRKQTGDLSVKSLHDVVSKSDFILGSDHLKTILLAIPLSQINQFINSYETLTDFVVPRSANEITRDSEYALFGLTLFKKYESQFISKARELKWIPRDFEYSDEIIQSLKSEFDLAKREESSLKNDLIRFVNIAYKDISSYWIHIKYLRAFVESVLRYGLPPIFYCFTLSIPNDSSGKSLDKSRKELVEKFGYLGGNNSIDKDSSLQDFANLVDTDYEPFVLYTVTLL